MSDTSAVPLKMWLADPLKPEVRRLIDRLCRAPDVRRIAIMPDVHAGEDVCIGAAVATKQLVYPQAVGSDIGCGMTTVRFGGPLSALGASNRHEMLRLLQRSVRILTRPTARSSVPGGPEPSALSHETLAKAADRDGYQQLGTLGRGNHFLEVQIDQEGALWVLVHSGSRAMGQVITRHHVRSVGAAGLASLDAGQPAGSAYLSDVAWACAYASASRRFMLEDAAAALEPLRLHVDWSTLIDSTHNMVQVERHDDQDLLIHRKGAARADLGQAGVIPGSAGTFTVHVEGRGCADALCSSSHGAGRIMRRGEARRTITTARLRRELEGVCFDERLAQKLTDEAPSAYRDLRRVLEAQRELVRTTRRLTPVVSIKGV